MLPLETIKFCLRCGHAMELRDESGRVRPVCPDCGWVHYFAPQVAAVAIVTRGPGEFLLVQRGENPGKGQWGLPGGFVELGETVETALLREVLEETGYTVALGPLVGVWSFFNDVRHISGVALIYETPATGGELHIASDSTAAQWVTYSNHTRYDLAFDSHRAALAQWHAVHAGKA